MNIVLQGVLVYKDDTLGDVYFNVKARDSFNDLRMRLAAVDTPFEEYNKACKCFDNVKTEEGTVVNEYYDLQGFVDSRRLDIKKNNKYKGNIQNRDMCARISAFIRYLQMSGKKNYGAAKASDFSTLREVDVFNGDTKLGTIKYNSGLIIGLDCENKYVRLHLDSVPDDTLEDAIFKELKEKDKYGKKVSFTPVENVGFKLCTETLGFEYVSQVQKEYANVLGMFETIEEVIANNPDKNTDWILQRDYQIVTDEILDDLFNDFMAHDGLIAFDTETTGLDITFKSRSGEGSELVGVVLSKKVGTGYYFPLQHKLFKNLCNGDHWYFMEKYMRPILEGKRIICHNVSYDWKVAYIYDINVNCVYDTMIAFGVTKRYEEETFEMGLKALAHNILGLDMFDLSDFVMGGSFGDSDVTFADLPYELVRRYAPADADMTLSLYEYLEHEDILNKYNAKRIFDMEIWFAKAVAYSEFYGYHIDTDRIPQLSAEIEGAMKEHTDKMFEMAGEDFNPNSSQQLINIMYNKLGIEVVGAKPSTNKEVLKTLSLMQDAEGNAKYPFVQELKAYRDNESIYKNFLKKLHLFATSDGYIFPEVLQFGTTTGRVSVKNPNYQSYNDIVKHYVVPRPGFYHFDSDFAQIEQRVLVSYSSILFDDYESLALLKDFNDPDMDYHQYQAARMFNVPYAAVTKSMRQQSKGINFGLPYGMGDESLGARIFGARNDENTRKAKDLRRKFFQGQELIEKFFETVRSNGVRDGYTSTQFGRRRYYHRGTFTVAEIRRQAGNHVIQGCLGGDTLIKVKELGTVKIKDVAGLSLLVWDGSKWSKGDITYSGKKKKCIVTFSDGSNIICSPIHKFLVRDSLGRESFIECHKLRDINSELPDNIVTDSNSTLLINSVEITDEYIDMYDVCNTDGGYYVANGVITHNTAADIYKMAVVNMFQRICKEGWLGKVLFNGFIHDEILMEVHESINPYYFFKVWRSEFEVKPENYCRLFAGAGVGKCWYDAKKLDLPPEYIEDIIQTYEEDMPWDENFDNFLQDVKDGFVRFKTNKVKKYLLDESNHGAIIKPAISALLPDEVGAIMEKVCKDQDLIVEYGNDLGIAIEFGKPFKSKDLQVQLKIFCKATGIDYNSIDIKSLDDVEIKQNNIGEDDEEVLEYDNSANIELFRQNIQRAGVYRDFATGQVVLGDVYLPNGVSVLNLCMKQGWIKTDNSGELKVSYVTNVNTENFEIHQTTCTMTHTDYNSLRAFYVNAIKMGGVVK